MCFGFIPLLPLQVSGHGWVAWLHFNIRWEVIWLRKSRMPLRWLLCKVLQWCAAVRIWESVDMVWERVHYQSRVGDLGKIA